MESCKETRILMRKPQAIDLFCGCGGLTTGLRQAGFWVRGGVDLDPLALECYRLNHPRTKSLRADITTLRSTDLERAFGIKRGQLDLLAGCPPCQGFSAMTTRNGHRKVDDPRKALVREYRRLALGLRPKSILMENVPGLVHDEEFSDFVETLERRGYCVRWGLLDAGRFGVPQRRRRLILMAGQGFKIDLPHAVEGWVSVRETIGDLPTAGRSGDSAHDHGESRSQKVRDLIRRIPHDGGSRQALGQAAQLECHRRVDGFKDVFGRMAWDEPAPTITSGSVNPSKGRFLHPTEDRSITIREAALLQSFPPDYLFPMNGGKFPNARLVGNAIPPAFAKVQGVSIKTALRAVAGESRRVTIQDG